MSKNIYKVGIAGAAGYTGGELIRLLLQHPAAEIAWMQSRSNAGKKVYEVHADLLGETEMHFGEPDFLNIDFLFLCLGHGESQKYLANHQVTGKVRVIDLSQDFRLHKDWIYGLPEMNRDKIRNSGNNIANPGCFATAIQLALLPLAAAHLLNQDIHVSAITGSTGAGQSLSANSHFSWRSNNISNYKSFEHQHLAEIGQSLHYLQPNADLKINFIPYRGSFTRGILATVYTPIQQPLTEIRSLYEDYYSAHPFTWISQKPVDVKQVVNTNKCFLHLEKHGEMMMITAAIDNLLKGASGQAVQNMNILAGLPENSGLNLKASAF